MGTQTAIFRGKSSRSFASVSSVGKDWRGELKLQENSFLHMTVQDKSNGVAFTMEMDAPESLDEFTQHMRSHYARYPRYTSQLVYESGRYHLEQVTDAEKLADFVRLHDECLDFEEM